MEFRYQLLEWKVRVLPQSQTLAYAIVFNSGTFSLITLQIQQYHAWLESTIPPIKTTTGFDETAKEAKTESTEKGYPSFRFENDPPEKFPTVWISFSLIGLLEFCLPTPGKNI